MTEAEWLAATDPQPMLRFLRSRRQGSDRKLRLFAVACCWPLWPWLTETCYQDAVLTAEKYADGLASERALARARAAMGPGLGDRHTASLREAVLAQTGDRRRAAAASAGWAASWDATRKALRVGRVRRRRGRVPRLLGGPHPVRRECRARGREFSSRRVAPARP
jgi:hypothetical protein